METRRRAIAEEFARHFGGEPLIVARAPGRVDLMGSHTDYNMGFVMTMTIDRDTWIAARPREDNQVAIYSSNVPGGALFSLDGIQQDEMVPWTNYVRGVADVMQVLGYELRGFDGLVHSTVPFGSGLSSSAALEMATAVLFARLGDLHLEPVEMALIGQKAENEFVGVSTGILDQYTSANGQEGFAILLDCRHLTSDMVRVHSDLNVVICNTRAERSLVGSEYDERRAQCEEGVRRLQQAFPAISSLRDVTPEMFAQKAHLLSQVVARRCQFIIEENQRVLDLARALAVGDRKALQMLFADSYRGARDQYEIGAPSMAAMMEAMSSAPGVVAARQAGAGFGGSMVALVEEGFVSEFAEQVAVKYLQETGIRPDVYAVQAARGASVHDWA